MGDSFMSAVTKSCRLGLKSKVIGHLSGCIGATCRAQRLEVTSMDSSDEGSLFIMCYHVHERTRPKSLSSDCIKLHKQQILQHSAFNKLKYLFFSWDSMVTMTQIFMSQAF